MSIVIVNWNTCAELRECLRSVKEADSDGTEAIVIDNASSDDSVEMVRREFPWARLIENDQNLGFARACNQGINAGSARYVLLLNSDSEMGRGTVTALVRFGDENPDVGIFGPKVLNPDGSLQHSCRRFPTLLAGVFRNSILGRLFPRNPYTRDYLMSEWDHSEPRDVDWVSGAAMVIRRELLDDVGALDEAFFMYCEDVDLAYRAKRRGWRVSYFPRAQVVHARARSSDKNPNRMIIEFHKSMYLFFRKHYARKASIFTWMLVPAGLFARASFFIAHNHFDHWKFVVRRIGRTPKVEESKCETKAVETCGEGHPDES